MPFTENHGATLHWRQQGEAGKPALLLLNSIGTDLSLWEGMMPVLAPHFHLLRMDARGHGASTHPGGDTTLATLADDAFAVLDAAGVQTAAIAGVSLGGMVAMEMALRHPARVSSLTLICTSAAMDRQAWTTRVTLVREQGMQAIADLAIGRFFSPEFQASTPPTVAQARACLLAMNPESYAAAGAAIRDMALLPRLGEIRQPTHIVVGATDSSTPYAGHGDVLERLLPHATLTHLPCGHLAPLEAPQQLAGCLLKFLTA